MTIRRLPKIHAHNYHEDPTFERELEETKAELEHQKQKFETLALAFAILCVFAFCLTLYGIGHQEVAFGVAGGVLMVLAGAGILKASR